MFKQVKTRAKYWILKKLFPELEAHLGFAYALLSRNQNASNMIQLNQIRASKLHQAIYERKPQREPYETMMARVKALYG